MKRSAIFIIAKKEFFGYINSPLAYTVIVPFLLISIFIYMRTVLVGGEATLRPYFELLPWFLLLLAPALSMKLLTDEYKANTFELLFAHPISELEIILGKFLGALTFYACILLTTIGLPLTILSYSKADPGQIISQYIGALFVGGTFLAVGLAASAYVKNAISSFLLSASVGFVLILIGLDFVLGLAPFPFNRILAELAVFTHMENIARGLLDIRDIAYFVTITGLFLVAAVTKLSERILAEDKGEKRKLNTTFVLIIAIGVIANFLLSFYPLRIDLTGSRLFTLSEGTKQTLQKLPDILNITVYASRDLPVQMQLNLQQITDTLKDYEKLSRNVKTKVVYPNENNQVAQEAIQAGIQEVTFNKIGSGKFEAQAGLLGIAVRYGDKTESIPFISDTSDLEYQLTRRIRKLTGAKDTIIGIYTNGFSQNQILDELLTTQYKTENLAVDDNNKLKDLSTLIVIDDGSQESTASAMIKNYLNQNGKVLLLSSGVSVSPQMLSAQKSKSTIPSLLSDYGVILNNDLVYDLQLSETLTFSGQGGQRFLAKYPYWLRALPASSDFAPLSTVKSISLGWPSSLTLTPKEGITQKKLLVTGANSGKIENSFNISPQGIQTLTPNAKEIPLAALIEKGDMRLAVVGSATAMDDQFLQNNRDNIAFLSNIIDYLIADKDLAAIPSKSAGRAVLEFKSPTDVMVAQYGNILIPPALVIAFAVFYLRRRKQLTRRIYEN